MTKPRKKTNPAQEVNRGEIEQLLTDQTSVILGAVDSRLGDQKTEILTAVDERLDDKFGSVTTQLDAIMKEVQAHREEDITGARQLRRHDDQLKNHELQIKALEAPR